MRKLRIVLLMKNYISPEQYNAQKKAERERRFAHLKYMKQHPEELIRTLAGYAGLTESEASGVEGLVKIKDLTDDQAARTFDLFTPQSYLHVNASTGDLPEYRKHPTWRYKVGIDPRGNFTGWYARIRAGNLLAVVLTRERAIERGLIKGEKAT